MNQQQPEFIRPTANGVMISIRVIPRAPKSQVKEISEHYVKITLKSPPVEGAANEELIGLLARFFSVSKKDICIKSGKTGKNKLVELSGVDKDLVCSVIKKQFEKSIFFK